MKIFFIQKIIFITSILLTTIGFSQAPVLEPKEIYPVTPLPIIRAEDVMWHRRIWREIDLTEKINQHLYFYKDNIYPQTSLYDILLHYINNGLLTAYATTNDRFTDTLAIDSVNQLSPENSKDVVKFWLKEDWIYNSAYSKIEVRIVGICPVKIKKDADGQIMGYEQLFWLYFPNIRGVLVNYTAFKEELTNNERVSFDRVFLDRMFNSYIINRGSKTEYHVGNNKTELDQKLELDKTKYYHLNTTTNLWGD